MSVLKPVLSFLFHEYWIGRAFMHRKEMIVDTMKPSLPIGLEMASLQTSDLEAMRCSSDPMMRYRCSELGPGKRLFGARICGELAAVCTFGFGEEYALSRGFFDLEKREAELTDIFTCSHHRGAGIAQALIRFSTDRMHEEGFRTLYAKVWHSNRASLCAFSAARWVEDCFFIRLCPRGTKKVWHLTWPTKRGGKKNPKRSGR